MAIRISRRSNTYDARNNRLTSRYLFLPYSDFGFRITDLGSRFMAFPLSKKSNPALPHYKTDELHRMVKVEAVNLVG